MPKCGNCKQSHPSVADIRACYEHDGKPTINNTGAPPPTRGEPNWPASEKQIAYALGLQEDKELPESHVVKTSDDLRAMERDEVSAQISLLRSYPWKDRRASDNQPKEYVMPEGRYAINHDGQWRFYEVTRSERPRWKGYTFIKQLVGAPGSWNKVDLKSPHRRYAVLDLIEPNYKRAMLDFGLQSGVCGRCGSPLSDPQSIADGIGPKCKSKMGW